MADNRKVFRARRLAFGGRCLPRACIFGALLALCAAFMPAQAQDTGLRNGAASLAAGKYDAAVRQLSATINSDNASPGDAAKALYLRGIAYRKMGEPARAAADLGAAIWLGLPEPDKVKALVNRGLAFQAAGLSKEGEAELAAARKAGGSRAVDDLIAEGGGAPEGAAAIAAFATEVRPEAQGGSSATVSGGEAAAPQSEPPARTANASPSAWSTSVAGEQQQGSSSSGNRLTRWFGSVTGSSTSEAAASARIQCCANPSAEQARAPALFRNRELELVHHDRHARRLGRLKRRREQEPLDAPVQPKRQRGARGATRAVSVSRRRLPPAACDQPLGGGGKRPVEKGVAEPRPRRYPAGNREGRDRQFRHLLQPQDRTLPGQGGKP